MLDYDFQPGKPADAEQLAPGSAGLDGVSRRSSCHLGDHCGQFVRPTAYCASTSKGSDLAVHQPEILREVEARLNVGHAKVLRWATPAEIFAQAVAL